MRVPCKNAPAPVLEQGRGIHHRLRVYHMSRTAKLLDFVRQLPPGFAYCPVYAKGEKLASGVPSKGKTPLEAAHHRSFGAADVALSIEQRPAVFQAVGVFTGIRSDGLVILDVDRNLATLKRKWGATLDGAPVVTSTKANAAKYLFLVPRDLWNSVKGCGLSDTGAGYEVLWGRQGLLYGAYPGASDGSSGEGEYALQGDLSAIPEAPAWLLAEMKAAKASDGGRGMIKNRKALDVSSRTPEEIAEIVQDCLSVIEQQGIGSRDHWLRIGMAIHSVLPDDLGLALWGAWSAQDPEYAEEWEKGNPCEATWKSFRPGAVNLGTLVWLADQVDPKRARFQEVTRKIVEAAEQVSTQRVQQVYLTGEEVLKRAKELEETLENPALLDQAKTALAMEAGRREGAIAIDRLLMMDMTYERAHGLAPRPIGELNNEGFEYLIPGLLPKPWTLLIHADGGTGKTAMCQTIAKHLSRGLSFNVYGALVPVPRSKVLWLNGDQNERIVRRQFEGIGVDHGVDVIGEWDMAWYRRFCRMQKEGQYDFVVIDSLDGCNDSNPYEENRREYARPIKQLARRNGVDFPACTIVVIHHNTKTGTFRGTSAIRAAVDETWNMRKGTNEELLARQLSANSRILSVEKSRDDREGMEMVFTLLPDFTYQIQHLPPRVAANTPNQHVLDVLDLMRTGGGSWSIHELTAHDGVGGEFRVRANRYALQLLEQQGLIERTSAPSAYKAKGRPPVFYKAVGKAAPGLLSRSSTNSLSRAKVPVEGVLEVETPVVERVLNDKAVCQKPISDKSPELEPGVARLTPEEAERLFKEASKFG